MHLRIQHEEGTRTWLQFFRQAVAEDYCRVTLMKPLQAVRLAVLLMVHYYENCDN